MSTQPLRIYIDSDFYETGQPLVMLSYLRNTLWHSLERYGIYKTNQPEKADFVLTSVKELSQARGVYPNTIVVENSDGCHFGGKLKWIDNSNISGWLKRCKADSYSGFGEKVPSCTHAITSNVKIPDSEYRVLPKAQDKIDVGFSFLYSDHIIYRHRREIEILRTDEKKDIDVFFAGTTTYGLSTGKEQTWTQMIATNHRQSCVSALKKLNIPNALILDSKSMNFEEYSSALRRSKIVVSPWGFGESCYRDYEGLLYECEVLKPQTPYRIESRPDIYRTEQDSWMRWVQPDWSNLGDVIDKSLSEWHQKKLVRRSRKNELIDALSYDYQARHISEVFKGIRDRNLCKSVIKEKNFLQSVA